MDQLESASAVNGDAGSYAEVMAEPSVAGLRLVAATLPGHAGAPLMACPNAHLVTIPGAVFFLPNQVPKRIADLIVDALAGPTV